MSYEYSLRLALQPGRDNNKRIATALEFCRQAQITDINLFINHEEIGHGHIPYAETKEWMIFAQQLKATFAAAGVSLSLNPGITLMHGDRGLVSNPKLGFTQMVDSTGIKATAVACPRDTKWQEYIVQTYGIYASVEPKYLWLEDDFRHFNHKPILWGCFCDLHMKEYQAKLGSEISRAEMVKLILQPGPPTKERQVYLDVSRDEMVQLAKRIENSVHRISPQTKVALMTSQPSQHSAEGRDWTGLFNNLSGKGYPFVARPHLPSYNEVTPKDYNNGFNMISRVTADILGDGAELFPELENYMYSRYAKSNRFTQFQLETSLVLHPQGSTMNLFDMMGTGVVPGYHLQDMLVESKDFLDRISDLNLKVSSQFGVKVLYGTKGSYTIETTEGREREEIVPREDSWLGLLGAFGISSRPQQFTKKIMNEIVAVSGQYLRELTDSEIKYLFQNNYLLLDGDSVAVLIERELGYLAKVEDAKWLPVRSGLQTYEQITDGHEYAGVAEARMTLMQQIGNFLRITYEDEQAVHVFSRAFNPSGDDYGPVCVDTGNCFILPITWDKKNGWNSQYISFKEELIKAIIKQHQQPNNFIPTTLDMPYCNIFNYKQDNREYYLIANFSTDSYATIAINLPVEISTLREFNRQGVKEVTVSDGQIHTPLASYEMKAFEVVVK